MSHADDRRLCGTLLRVGTSVADTTHGAFRVETFLNLSSRALVLVLCHGDGGADPQQRPAETTVAGVGHGA